MDCLPGTPQLWRFLEDYVTRVRIDDTWYTITNRGGAVTDLASVPAITKNIIDDDDPRALFPACPHDALYENGGRLDDGTVVDRATVDEILRVGMLVRGASGWIARAVFLAVRAGGGKHWPKLLPLARMTKIDGKRVVSLPMAVLVGLASALVTATLTGAKVVNRIEETARAGQETAAAAKANSERLSRLELSTARDIQEIKTDVRWIKQAVERRP